jgi:tRNA uridine 5-carboxymethylaminomethyl modification enzyme
MDIGCVGAERGKFFLNKMSALESARSWAQSVSITPNEADRFGLVLNRDGQRRTAYQLLSYPHVDFATIGRIWPEASAIDRRIAEQIETDAKYAVYLARQAEDVERFRRDEALPLPDGMDYTAIAGLSMELRQKLAAVRPRTVGQADRIDGMTPAALALVALHARRAG